VQHLVSDTLNGGPHARLACAVIHQAMRDAASSAAPSRIRREARQFLSDGPRLGFWCAIAGVSVRALRDQDSPWTDPRS